MIIIMRCYADIIAYMPQKGCYTQTKDCLFNESTAQMQPAQLAAINVRLWTFGIIFSNNHSRSFPTLFEFLCDYMPLIISA